jgi:TPR repeat protein
MFKMTGRWKLGIGVCVAVCGAGLVGGIYIHRAIVRHKLVQAASIGRARAEKGDANAQFDLASMYYAGKGVPQDYAEALGWSRKAADQGYAKAQDALGFMYYEGKGVPQDFAEAARWYGKASDQGYAKAQFGLASMYYDGKGVPQDYSEAARWYRKAAEQGDAQAQLNLGFMYHQGKGVQQDYTEAIRWYRKAAYQGNAEAEYNLGYMYYYGQGLPQDYTDAIRWYLKAAEQGYPDAQRALRSIDRKSSIATTIRYVVLFIAFLGGSVLSFGFLWPGRSFRNSRHATVLGVIALSYAGLSLYGIAHDDMRYSVCRNAFYLAQGLLIGMAIIMGVTIIVTKQRRVE